VSDSPIDAIERVLAQHEDVDDALQQVVVALTADPAIVWAGIAFLDAGAFIDGPSAGLPDDTRRTAVPITYGGAVVGELRADGDPDRRVLEHVAALIAPQVLIGWDTGGEAWEP
jgi:hypothetical protein